MASPENPEANDLFGWLFTIVRLYVRRKKLGRIFGSRVAFKLSDEHGPEPDIAFVRTENLHRVKSGHVEGAADLAVEIVSPESVDRDYYQKRELYEEFGIPEYWIIDEMDESVMLLRLKQGQVPRSPSQEGRIAQQSPRRLLAASGMAVAGTPAR